MNNIILSGSHCTGKTTMVQFLTETVPSIKIVSSTTRGLKKLGFPINNDQTDNYSITQLLGGNRDFENMLTNSDCVFDRTLIDKLAYTRHLVKQGKVAPWVQEMQEKQLSLLIPYFKHIFLLTPDFPLVGDGVRSEDEQFRQAIHQEFLQIFQDFNIPYHQLMGTLEFKKSVISEYFNNN